MLGALGTALAGLCLWVAPASVLEPAPWRAEVDRLEGHTVRIGDGSYEILDIAGEGAPLVGCIVASDRGLELVTVSERHLVRGPLAVPRIAGPNYKVWIIGSRGPGNILNARRLGILAGPSACQGGARAPMTEPTMTEPTMTEPTMTEPTMTEATMTEPP